MKKVIWKGFFEGDTGYIRATKMYPYALEAAGIDVGIAPFSPLKEGNPLNRFVTKEKDNTFSILHQLPTVSPNEDGYYTVTEFNVAPHEWWMSMDKAKIILTQSKFCKGVFAKIPDIDASKIHVAHFPVDPLMSPEGEIMQTGKKYSFLFGSVFEWVARKKPELMWKAFREEFPIKDYPDVGFVNKISIPQGMYNWKYHFNEYTERDPRISVIQGRIPDMGMFYRALDCYCSPTAGEGWGATLCEAMACGIPTIGSRHSGNLEFMNDSNSYLVDCEKYSYIGDDKLNKLWMVHPYQKWRLPKVESIRKVMRIIYETHMSGKTNQRALEGLKVKSLLSIENVGEQLKSALMTVL